MLIQVPSLVEKLIFRSGFSGRPLKRVYLIESFLVVSDKKEDSLRKTEEELVSGAIKKLIAAAIGIPIFKNPEA